jgi:hypothetical protein
MIERIRSQSPAIVFMGKAPTSPLDVVTSNDGPVTIVVLSAVGKIKRFVDEQDRCIVEENK